MRKVALFYITKAEGCIPLKAIRLGQPLEGEKGGLGRRRMETEEAGMVLWRWGSVPVHCLGPRYANSSSGLLLPVQPLASAPGM